jgi:LysM repeat protein
MEEAPGIAVGGRNWKGYAAPAAFLLAVTIGVVVLRSVGVGTADQPAAPPASATIKAKPAAAAGPRFYTVKAGDTVTAIAVKTHLPLTRIRALNPSLRPTALFIGEKIRLR